MKTFLLGLLLVVPLLIASVSLTPSSASAVDLFSDCGTGSASGTPTACADAQAGQKSARNPAVVAIRIAIQLMAVVVGLGAVIGIIVSSIRMSIAHGDANAVSAARTGLVYSLIGLGIAALAQVIVFIIIGFFN